MKGLLQKKSCPVLFVKPPLANSVGLLNICEAKDIGELFLTLRHCLESNKKTTQNYGHIHEILAISKLGLASSLIRGGRVCLV